mgnify:CR=1 FL=1
MRTVCAWYQVPQSYWRGWFFARFLRAYVQNATEGRLPEWDVRVDGQTGIKQILLDSYTQSININYIHMYIPGDLDTEMQCIWILAVHLDTRPTLILP